MRCLHVISGDLWAGAEVSTFNLLSELRERHDLTLTAIVLNDGELSSRLRRSSIETVVIDERAAFPRLAARVLGCARRFGPDVVHSHRTKEHVLGALISLACGATQFRTQHGVTHAPATGLRTRAGALLDSLAARAVRCHWFVVSEEQRSRVPAPARRVHLLRNGLPAQAAEASREPLKLAYADELPSWFIGFVGRLESEKRPDRFLDVLAGVPRELGGRAVRAVIVGDGSMRESLAREIQDRGLGDRVRLLGRRPDGDAIIGGIDVLVVPSDLEGHPMVLLEAMRARTPVVASAVGGIREILGASEFVVDPGRPEAMAEAVTRLLESQAERGRWSDRLHSLFRAQFTVGSMADTVLAHYRRAIG